ncbi:MAG: ExbD/TolR family protein, partial [Planctomycetota bacterium]
PMIDVTFLLIIFFLIVTELSDAAKEKLELPRAERAVPDQHEHGRLVINITKDGDFFIQRTKHNKQEIMRQLELEKAMSWDREQQLPTRAILVRVDEKTPWYHVYELMKLCMEKKLWKIAFATKDLTRTM